LPETIYNNRYRLDAKVGEGGMAVVYRGYDLLLRRQVAVKVLRPQFAADQAFVHRFSQEAQAAAKLSHPNIVNTYDVGDSGEAHFIVQEFVAGETLASLISREKRLPEAAAIRYGMQICAALSAAHRNELLHRDIKPSNILITSDDVVRVADFGIARAANAQTATNQDDVLASVPYGAPEHLTGQKLCDASDLYSVGVVLFEMVTGKRPFDAETAMGVAMAHVNAPVPDPVEAGAAIGPRLRAVILRLLSKSPKDRYQSAGEALVALRRSLDAEGLAENGRAAGPGTDRESDTAVVRRKQAAADARRRWFAGLDDASPSTWDSRRLITVASVVVAAILIVVVALAVRQSLAGGPRVPDLTGKTTADAIAALHAFGVDDVRLQPREDATVPAGLSDGSDPAPGAPLARGSTVTLFVSAGPATEGMPNVIGRDTKTAQALLAAAGFSVRVGTSVHSTAVAKGLVAKTNPAPGANVAKSGTVVLFPSGGPAQVTVPNVVDLSDADARNALAKAGLALQVSQIVPNVNIAPQTVMDQDPNGGSPAPPGSTVVVEESGGPNSITVPSVVGGTLGDARNALTQAGLTVGQVGQVEDASTTPGTVVSQNPQPGAQAGQGSAVDVYIAVEPSSPAPSASPSASPGAALPPVPNVTGMNVDDARAALVKAGFSANSVTVLPGSPPNAKVVNTQPAPGATVAPGTTEVDLIVGPGH
jgi:beta-lactam-binding protein with PASTA domain/tRNA A-37 threonylcarbamoyl transferase component Bud32